MGEWLDKPNGDAATGRPFNRVLCTNWRLEHVGGRFVIRQYELSTAQTILAI